MVWRKPSIAVRGVGGNVGVSVPNEKIRQSCEDESGDETSEPAEASILSVSASLIFDL